jgi:hypothetical protein
MMVFIFWSKRFSITVSMNLQWVLEKLLRWQWDKTVTVRDYGRGIP